MAKQNNDSECNVALFHEFNVARLRAEAAKWADEYPIIEQVILCEGYDELFKYILVLNLREPCLFKTPKGELADVPFRIRLRRAALTVAKEPEKKKDEKIIYPLFEKIKKSKDKISKYIRLKTAKDLSDTDNVYDWVSVLNRFIEEDKDFFKFFQGTKNIPPTVKAFFNKAPHDKTSRARLNRHLLDYAYPEEIELKSTDDFISPVHSDEATDFFEKSSISGYPLPKWLQRDLKSGYQAGFDFVDTDWLVWVQGIKDNELSDDTRTEKHEQHINEHAVCYLYDRQKKEECGTKSQTKISQEEKDIITDAHKDANRLWKRLSQPSYNKKTAQQKAPEYFDRLNNESSFICLKKEMLINDEIYPQNKTPSGKINTHAKKIFINGLIRKALTARKYPKATNEIIGKTLNANRLRLLGRSKAKYIKQ